MLSVAGIHHFLFDYEQESFNVTSFSDVSGKKKKTAVWPTLSGRTRSSIHFPRWLESSLVMQGLLLLHTVNKFRLSTLLSRSKKNRGKDEAHTQSQPQTPMKQYDSTFSLTGFIQTVKSAVKV